VLAALRGSGPAPPAGTPYAAAGNIKTFICPSAPAPESATNMTQINPVGVLGKHFPSGGIWSSVCPNPNQKYLTTYIFAGSAFTSTISQTGKTNYLANIGYADIDSRGLDGYQGPFRLDTYAMPITGISDGTSNTIGFMETAGGFVNWGSGNANNGWYQAPYGHGHTISNFGTCPNATNGNCSNTPEGRGLARGLPGSVHPGGRINTMFMDGSIRAFSGSVDFTVYVYMCGAQDGQVVAFE